MSILKSFQEIKTVLKTVPELHTVRFWNNQIDREPVENAFNYPAVFVEFLPIDWTSDRYKLQKGEADISIHICVEEYNTENINEEDIQVQALDIVSKVHKVLQGYTSDVIAEPLNRISSQQPTDHNNIIEWIDIYRTVINDSDNCTEDGKTELPAGTLSASFTKIIDIDNDNIRTGDGDFTEPPPAPVFDPFTDEDMIGGIYYNATKSIINTNNIYGDVDAIGVVTNLKNALGASAYDLKQTVTTQKPSLIGGAIVCDGVNDFLISDSIPSYIASNADHTAYIIYRIKDVSKTLMQFRYMKTGDNTQVVAYFYASNSDVRVTSKDDAPTSASLQDFSSFSNGQKIEQRVDYKNSWEMIINQGSSITSPNPTRKSPTGMDKIIIGSNNIQSAFFETEFLGALVFNKLITDSGKLALIQDFIDNNF